MYFPRLLIEGTIKSGHYWVRLKCPELRGVGVVKCTFETDNSVLFIEVPLIQRCTGMPPIVA